MGVYEVMAVFGLVMFLAAGVLMGVHWRDPTSRWFRDYLHYFEDRIEGDAPARAAAYTWGTFGFAAGALPTLYSMAGVSWLPRSGELVLGSVLLASTAGCFAIGLWFRFGHAPRGLRPAALREPSARS